MILDTETLTGRERYELLTSLVVPRPIAWVSTRSADGTANLAPFSYFAALAATPMLVGVSIGSRRREPKDTLRNIRHTQAFCINVVTEQQLEAMNATSAELDTGIDEFEWAGLQAAEAELVNAPYVASCPAVFECRLFKEVELGGAPNTLVIGEIVRVHLAEHLSWIADRRFVETESLQPVGRLWGGNYAVDGRRVELPRPTIP